MKAKYTRKELTDIYGIADVIRPEQALIASIQADIGDTVINDLAVARAGFASDVAPASDSWEAIQASLADCKRCRLAETRKNIVFGEGNRQAELMFIGEGPGAEEDQTGRPFVGKAGQLLTKMIAAMGYKREEVFIGNIVKCRPPDNRDPFKDETQACIGFIQRQIALINPKVIITLGGTATISLLNSSLRISQLRGRWQKLPQSLQAQCTEIKVMPTFHPAYLLRNESAKKDAWKDLQMVMAELKQ